MAVLQYKDPITGQMVDLPMASSGIKDAPKDGKQYVRQDGEWSEINAEITIDTELSDTSTNAVQNKVVKSYVDNQVGSINAVLETIIAG